MNAPYSTWTSCPGPCDRCGAVVGHGGDCKACTWPKPARELPDATEQMAASWTREARELRAARLAAKHAAATERLRRLAERRSA